MRIVFSLMLSGLLAAAPAPVRANAAPDAPSSASEDAWLRYHLAVAESPGDALSDAYLARALEMVQGDEARQAALDPALLARVQVVHGQLEARAAAARNNDATLLVSQLRCLPASRANATCEADLARLAELAGDNAYHHVVLMGHAWARGDAEAFLREARLAAEAAEYQHDVPKVFGSLYRRYSQVPAHDLARPDPGNRIPVAGMSAMAFAAALALPAYQHFVQPCREAEGDLQGHCLAIAVRMMREGQLALDLSIAAGVIDVHGDESLKAEAKRRQREMAWHFESLRGAEARLDERQWRDYLDAYAERGELAAFRVAHAYLGRPALPPDDWNPPGESAGAR